MAKAEETTALERAFERWKTMAELQLQFVETLGKYKLEAAKTELVAAVAAGQWAVARMKAGIAQELELALRRLNRLRGQTARRIRRLNRHAKSISKISSGEDLPPEQLTLMWAAYTVFERMTPMTVLEELINTPVHTDARKGSSYVNVRHRSVPCKDPPDTVDNVHSLISWIKRRGYMPRRGTHSYRHVVGGVARIANVAETEIESLEKHLLDIEKRVYDTWQPVVLAALPDSIDVKKIIRIGS